MLTRVEGTNRAVLSRAEAALAQGDLTTTVAELNRPAGCGPDRDAGKEDEANIRLAAQDAVVPVHPLAP